MQPINTTVSGLTGKTLNGMIVIDVDGRIYSGTLVSVKHYLRGRNRWTLLSLDIQQTATDPPYRKQLRLRGKTKCKIITMYTDAEET